MAQLNQSGYLVVKIMDIKDRKTVMGHKCIPGNWVQNSLAGNYVIFRYPPFNDDETEFQVQNKQVPDKNWPTYYGPIIKHTDSYEEALRVIENINKEQSTSANRGPIIAGVSGMSGSVDTRPTTNDSNALLKPIRTSNRRIIRKKMFDYINEDRTKWIVTSQKGLRMTTKAISPQKYKLTKQSMARNQKSMDNNGSDVNKKNASNSIMYAILTNSSPQTESIHNNTRGSEGTSSLSEADIDNDNIKKMSSLTKIIENMASSPAIINSITETELKRIENFYNTILQVRSKIKANYEEANSILKDAIENIKGVPKENNDYPQQKPRSIPKSRFVFNMYSGSKWTLRHKGPGKGLVELLPNTGVYVSEEEINRCCDNATRDMKKLARVLLPVVFTIKALRKCTFTGARHSYYVRNKKAYRVKPALDKTAREALIEFVVRFAAHRGYEVNEREVKVSIRNRLNVYKFKNGRRID